ncbi:MAG TPA: HlyD family secretion protein [Rhizomicrobium sp.]|jgi:membrane fusion protein (multidrug efflux system)|nr:HlyD family secretion protein [Rhizomicrobium sp.]
MTVLGYDVTADGTRAGAQRGWGQIRDFGARMRADKSLLRKVLMYGGVALVAAITAIFWLTGGRYVSSDDTYVMAGKLMVSTDVSGLVQDVDVHEGQHVNAGQVLFRLDPRQFQIAVDNAKAQLAQTALTIQAMKADYQRMIHDADAQRANAHLAQVTNARNAALVRSNAVSQATFDQSRAGLSSAQSQLASLQEQAQETLIKLGGSLDVPVEKNPQYMAAKAQLDEAERQLNHTVVRAPFSGTVTAVDSLQVGTLVISALSAFSTTSAVGLVSDKNIWIEANFKETDLTYVKNGDPVDISIDTYPSHSWTGTVDSVSPATGAAFSVLPAENSSGNWVKVVQRIPVRVKINTRAGDPPLRAGMSANVDIDTGKRRWDRMLFGN